MYTNIASLNREKLIELHHRVYCVKPDIILLTETWLTDTISDGYHGLQHLYSTTRCDRESSSKSRGGGVMALVKYGLHYQQIQCACEEGVSLQIHSNGRTINVTVINRPSDCDTEQGQLILQEIMKTTTSKRIIVGDFNLPDINWTTSTAYSTFSRDFLSTVQENGFHQLVSEHTRSRGKQSSLLDLVMVSDDTMAGDIQYQEPIAKSDHSVILFNVMSMKPKITSRNIAYYDYGTLCDDHLSLYMNRSTLESMDNIENMWNYFQCGMKSCIDQFVPVRMFVKRNRVNLPRNLLSLMRRKNNIWNNYRHGFATYDEYKIIRN